MLAAMLMVACVVGQAPVQAQELVPDPDWSAYKASPGDLATVYIQGGSVFGGTDVFAYYDGMKFLTAKDARGFDELASRGRLALLDSGTSVKIIKLTKGISDIPSSVEVRVLDGPQKGKALHVAPGWLAQLIPADQAAAKQAQAKQSAKDFEARLDREIAAGEAQLRQMQAGVPVAPPDPLRAEAQALRRYLGDPSPGQGLGGYGAVMGGREAKAGPRPAGTVSQWLERGEAVEATDPQLAALYYRAIIKAAPKASQAAKAKGHLKTMGQPR